MRKPSMAEKTQSFSNAVVVPGNRYLPAASARLAEQVADLGFTALAYEEINPSEALRGVMTGTLTVLSTSMERSAIADWFRHIAKELDDADR